MNFKTQFLLTVFLVITGSASAQSEPDPLTKLITEMFRTHGSKTLCLPPNGVPVESIRSNILARLRTDGPDTSVTAQKAAETLWTLYPCPFTPFRKELRAATSADVAGAWVYARESQFLRRGPSATQQPFSGPLAITCEAVGYFPDGELRTAIFTGQRNCPFESASDFDSSRQLPRVSSWRFLRDGRIAVTRTDVQNHIEEWDVYVVTEPFEFSGVNFYAGDLVSYARRGQGNEVGAATQFRHLKRLR